MNTPSLREKLEWAMASSIKAPAGSNGRMVPISGMKKIERDLQIDRVEQLLRSELQSQAEKYEAEKVEAVKEELSHILDTVVIHARKGYGASWQRGYVSAQHKVRSNIKKRIAVLSTEKNK